MKVDAALGQLKSFELPGAWLEEDPVDLGNNVTRIYRLIENTAIIFGDHYRSYPLSRSASKEFQQSLYAEFHSLEAEEIEKLAAVLQAFANPAVFTIEKAETDYLNDHRVIKILGNWTKSNETSIAFFLDVFGKGKFVHTIYFTTPASLFTSTSGLIESVCRSIQWVDSEN